jgi:hypothetical protein
MILKDESASIRQVLETVKPFVDQWCILDTGSTDGTQDIVREVLADIPGDFYEEPFAGYAESRNRVLALQEQDDGIPDGAIFSLMLSGDEFLRGGGALREYLETQRDARNAPEGAYKVRLTLDGDCISPHRIFRSGSGWHYEDAGLGVHEFAAHANPDAPVGIIPHPSLIEHIVSDPERRFTNVWENHIPLLRSKLDPECGGDPDNPRALLFLANSLKSLFAGFHPSERITYAMEAMSLYLRRLALPFATEHEHNYVKLCYLDCARLTGVYSDAEMYARVEELAIADPKRPEVAFLRAQLAVKVLPLSRVYALAAHAAQVATEAMHGMNDSPVSLDIAWQAHHLAAVAAKQLAQKHPEVIMREKYAALVSTHVELGIASGGQRHVFEGILPNEPQVL